MMRYRVRRAVVQPGPRDDGDSLDWRQADIAEIAHFRPESSAHRPAARARLLHDGAGLHGLFQVDDRWVRSVQTTYQAPVCTDSCVEFFVRPRPDRGYFNFEFNCGGTLLCSYITQPRTPGAIRLLSAEEGGQVRIEHSLPAVVEPEIEVETRWTIAYFIPLGLLERYVGPLGPLTGQTWRANFYKCGDRTSHPHWAAWSPVDALDFHMPQCFGELLFA